MFNIPMSEWKMVPWDLRCHEVFLWRSVPQVLSQYIYIYVLSWITGIFDVIQKSQQSVSCLFFYCLFIFYSKVSLPNHPLQGLRVRWARHVDMWWEFQDLNGTRYIQVPYLVGGLEPWNFMTFHLGKNHPHWRTHMLQRGGSTTNQILLAIEIGCISP